MPKTADPTSINQTSPNVRIILYTEKTCLPICLTAEALDLHVKSRASASMSSTPLNKIKKHRKMRCFFKLKMVAIGLEPMTPCL